MRDVRAFIELPSKKVCDDSSPTLALNSLFPMGVVVTILISFPLIEISCITSFPGDSTWYALVLSSSGVPGNKIRFSTKKLF